MTCDVSSRCDAVRPAAVSHPNRRSAASLLQLVQFHDLSQHSWPHLRGIAVAQQGCGSSLFPEGSTVASLSRVSTTIGAAVAALTFGFTTPLFAQVVVGGYPYPAYRYAAPDAAMKFDVKPKDTMVYVDGFYAGIVDDFDGAFQRLRTSPGPHQLTLYLDGYRTYSERVYLSPDNTLKLKHRMERLAPGEVSERPPAPPPPPQYQSGQAPLPDQGGPLPRGRRGRGPTYPPYPPDNSNGAPGA